MAQGRLFGQAAKALAKGVRRRKPRQLSLDFGPTPKEAAVEQRLGAQMGQPSYPDVPAAGAVETFWATHFEEIAGGVGQKVAEAARRGDPDAQAKGKAWVRRKGAATDPWTEAMRTNQRVRRRVMGKQNPGVMPGRR